MGKQYETVIGLEVHVELATRTKIFCGCSTVFGGAPNTHTCPVCTGMPGSLPVLNHKVLEYAVKVGLATNCEITRYSKFDRKNYFYPDNPQNYQISQLYLPICHDGFVEIPTQNGMKKIGIHEIHMEEDAGKLIHDEEEDVSLVDYNRCGVPLIEIVTEPDMRSAQEVIAYLDKLRMLIQYLGASDCKLQEGSMRADVNLSIREVGTKEFGTRTEMKNLNSFKAISRAIEGEKKRQIDLLESGEVIVQETRRWDDVREISYPMRSKEDAKDYRYFPDPDLPPILIEDEWLTEQKKNMPEFREEKMKRYGEQYNLPDYDIGILTQTKQITEILEKTVALGADAKKVSNWLMGETMRLSREKSVDLEKLILTPQHFYDFLQMIEKKEISGPVAKEVFEQMFLTDCEPLAYVSEHGLKSECDDDKIAEVVAEVIANNPKCVKEYQAGKGKAIGALVGQTMKAMGGKADPVIIRQLIEQKITE